MQGTVYYSYRDQDPLNLNKDRNIRNANKGVYNCAGYALGCFSWYCPQGINDAISAEKKTAIAVESMLNDFPNLRVISALDELLEGEEAIAFRVEGAGGYRNDFHYIVRKRNGHWYHKRGSSYFIHTMSAKEVFSSCWCNRYYGPLILFAKKG